ncbi:MAG: hypothetical protein FWD11_04945 [Micrococcales bacterium]|nr:hypothetical protein [Micrococcales bacterium]
MLAIVGYVLASPLVFVYYLATIMLTDGCGSGDGHLCSDVSMAFFHAFLLGGIVAGLTAVVALFTFDPKGWWTATVAVVSPLLGVAMSTAVAML